MLEAERVRDFLADRARLIVDRVAVELHRLHERGALRLVAVRHAVDRGRLDEARIRVRAVVVESLDEVPCLRRQSPVPICWSRRFEHRRHREHA